MIASLRRSKMVSFRLSLEEYARFQTLCEERGIRSLSDFARTAVHNMAASDDTPDPLWQEVGHIRSQMTALSRELDRIAGLLEARRTNHEAHPSVDTPHGRD
jgi:hypothetical protein